MSLATPNVSELLNENKAKIAAIFMEHLESQRESDPLIGAKIGGKELLERLLAGMQTEKGVHAESLLCALGSLAGYSCQAAVRAEWVDEKGQPEKKVFSIIETQNRQRFFFGDLPNQTLGENEYSVLKLSAAAALELGLGKLIDFKSIFEHVAGSIGWDHFGTPRLPAGHQPGDLPINYVMHLWPSCLELLKQFCAKPAEWPILLGVAIQQGMRYCKDVIDPALALTIVMESAIPMAKIDLQGKLAQIKAEEKTRNSALPFWLHSQEAKVVCVGSIIHIGLAIFGPLGLGYLELPFLYTLTSLIIPFMLLICAYRFDVFKKDFQGMWLDKVLFWGIALMPVLLQIYNFLKAQLV